MRYAIVNWKGRSQLLGLCSRSAGLRSHGRNRRRSRSRAARGHRLSPRRAARRRIDHSRGCQPSGIHWGRCI